MKKKQCLVNSACTFVICALSFNIIFYLKHGPGYLYVDDLMYGIPIWTLLLTYAAYGSTQRYYAKKGIYLPEHLAEDQKEYRMKEWTEYRKYALSGLLKGLGLMFGMAAPAYLLAYMDGSEFLKSSPFKIMTFAVLAVLCLAVGEALKRNYFKYIRKE